MSENEKLDLILSEVQGMKKEIQGMKGEVQAEIQGVEEKLQGVQAEIQSMKEDIQEVKQRVIKTDIIVENEIRVNIQRVAEGHLDLSRKLNECIKISNDVKDRQEIQDIYINMHNSKLKAL